MTSCSPTCSSLASPWLRRIRNGSGPSRRNGSLRGSTATPSRNEPTLCQPPSSSADRERSFPVTETSGNRNVVIIGDALIDEIHRDGSVDTFVGGAALNVAVGWSVLGFPATLLAMIGDDADGERIRAFLVEHGVTLIPTIGPNGSSRAVSDRVNGEPVYVFNTAAQQ